MFAFWYPLRKQAETMFLCFVGILIHNIEYRSNIEYEARKQWCLESEQERGWKMMAFNVLSQIFLLYQINETTDIKVVSEAVELEGKYGRIY